MHSCYNFNFTKALLHVLGCEGPSPGSWL